MNPKTNQQIILHLYSNIVIASNECWEWIGGINNVGYGQLTIDGKTDVAHRISFRVFKGKDPGKLYVCHKCDNRKCINPDHLFLGTALDNILDAQKKGRLNRIPWGRGTDMPNSVLNDDIVDKMRAAYDNGETAKSIAGRYGFNLSTVKGAVQRATWKHVGADRAHAPTKRRKKA